MRGPAGQRQAGFTLIEVLIAVGIMALVGLMAAALLRLGAVTGAASTARSSLLQEAQIAQQLISGRLSEALWVYQNTPAGAASISLANSGPTTLNNVGASSSVQWRVNTDPFVALILPPKGPGANCTTVNDGVNSEGCYRFFAYYAVRRTPLASDTTLADSSRPKVDAANPDGWVLMEYRANLFATSLGGSWLPNFNNGALTDQPNQLFYMGRSGRLLADYVQPGSVSFCVTPPTAAGQLSGRVTFTFNMQRSAMGTIQQIKSDTMKTTVTPRNWRTTSVLPTPTTACS